MPSLYEEYRLGRERERLGQTPQPTAPVPQQAPPAPMSLYDEYRQERGLPPRSSPAAAQTQAAEEPSVYGFGENLVSDAGDIISGLYQAVRHPIETGKAIAQNPSALVQPYAEQISDPIGYGYEKPLSSLLNVSAGSGLLGIAAKAGKAGKVAQAANTVSRYTDPLLGTGKLIAGGYKGTKGLLRGYAGTTSGTYKPTVDVAAQTGYNASYQAIKQLANERLGTKFNVPARGATTQKDYFVDHMRGKRDPEEGANLVDQAEAAIYADAQRKLDTRLNNTFASNPANFRLDDVYQALEAAENEAHIGTIGRGSGVASKVLQRQRAVIDEWQSPPDIQALAGNLNGLARNLITGDAATAIRRVGGNPNTMTARQYLTEWQRTFRSPKGIDELKRKLAAVYPKYTKKKGVGDAYAKKAAATVANSAKKLLSDRFGNDYTMAMKEYAADRALINKTRQTLGYNPDTVSRRVTSITRDTAFTDFGARLKTVMEFAERAKQAGFAEAMNIPQIAAGRSARSVQPRNMIGLAGAGGFGIVTGSLLANPLLGAMVFFAHTPRVVGSGAYNLGKIEGYALKPVMAAVNTLEKYVGITPRGIGMTAAQVGKAQQEAESKFQAGLAETAEKLGYKIHPRVLNKISRGLLADNPDEFVEMLKTVSGHKRLMKLLETAGGQP